MATWKQIEQRRETRLWISQVIMPAITFIGTMMAIPEVREAVKTKAKQVKERIEFKWINRKNGVL